MATWYECKVKYLKTDENGKQKMVTEPYLVDAISFTEAESRITEIITEYVYEFKVTNIKVANFSEIHPFDDVDCWFKAKVGMIIYDEEREKEKISNCYMLVQANDVKEAYNNLENVMESTMADYKISAIQESPILDVFPYFTKEEEALNAPIPEGFVLLKNEEE